MTTLPRSEEDFARAFGMVNSWTNIRLPNGDRWRCSGCACICHANASPLFIAIGRTVGPAAEQEQARYRRNAEAQTEDLARRPAERLHDGAVRLSDGTILAYSGLVPPWNEAVCLVVAWILGLIDETELHQFVRTDREVRTRLEKLRSVAEDWIRSQREARAAS
jgi:hypothetical protein